ncbi:MAG: glycosyltransferase [Acetobacteraceae bacterium]|nr:glycosyltransferase [Acetobacteraceae bacterium]
MSKNSAWKQSAPRRGLETGDSCVPGPDRALGAEEQGFVTEGDDDVRHIAGASCPPSAPYDADIVILALDRAEETCAAIDSALAQQGLTRHVVVLDQGSCPAALDRLATHVAGRPDVTLLAGTRNRGVAGGRNLGTARGHGRIVAALDNDAEFATPTTLASAVAALDDNPALGIIGCRIVVYATGADDLSSWGYPARLQTRAAQTFDTATFVGAGHAIRRTAWNAAGGYDPALFFCWEEFDLARRAIAAGWRVQYRGDLVIRHKVSGERRVAWSDARWFQHVRNRLYLGRKYGDTWLTLAPRIAGYLVKGARNGLLSQTLAAIAAAGRMPHHPALLLTPAAQAYLHATDIVPRGGWIERLRREVLAEIPRTPDAPAGPQPRMTRSRSNRVSTAGLSSK